MIAGSSYGIATHSCANASGTTPLLLRHKDVRAWDACLAMEIGRARYDSFDFHAGEFEVQDLSSQAVGLIGPAR